jgi:serine/threonine-protein kinase
MLVWCAYCGALHDMSERTCPATGKPILPRGADRPLLKPSPPKGVARPAVRVSTPAGPLPPRDPTGSTFAGKYRIRGVLGRGGMGTVFEAERLSIGGVVAIKVLHSGRTRDAKAIRRFHKEARAAAAIGHPNICEVHDLGGLEDGTPYLVMERLVGETLAVRLARQTVLNFDEAIDVLVQVLSALAAAHEKGIVHRDIKPENIFLAERLGCPPFAKVLDFGISKVNPLHDDLRDDTRLTQPGVVMGTPIYMAPEQARGDRNLDARVDIYACGVILYEALTGRRPFPGRDLQTILLQSLTTRPPLASELRPGLPEGLDEVLERALARGRDDRYPSAREMQVDLHALRAASSASLLPAPDVAKPPIERWVDPSAQTAPLPAIPPNAVPEPPPSSLDIPIEFTTESPASGAILPPDAPADEEFEDDTIVTHVERTELLRRVRKQT